MSLPNESDHTVLCAPVEPVDYRGFYFLFTGVFQTLLTLVGVLGNLAVLSVSRMRVNIFGALKPYLNFLAAWDIMLLICAWTLFCLPSIIYGATIPLHGRLVYMYYLLYPVCNAAYAACVWVNVLCSVERYMAVCKPLWHRIVSRSRRFRAAFAGISSFALLFNAVRYFEYHIAECAHNATRRIEPLLAQTHALANSELYINAYVFASHLLLITVGPFLVLVGLNVRIWCTARHSLMDRQLGQNPPSKQYQTAQRLTCMLLFVSAKFLLCYCLTAVLDGMNVVLQESLLYHPAFPYLVDISNAMVAMHSATNFCVYLLCQRRFRRACRKLFCAGVLLHVGGEVSSPLCSTVAATIVTPRNGAMRPRANSAPAHSVGHLRGTRRQSCLPPQSGPPIRSKIRRGTLAFV